MKRNFDQALKNMDGTPLLQGPLDAATISRAVSTLDEDTQNRVAEAFRKQSIAEMTLAKVAAGALGAAYEDEKNLADDERMRRWKLGTRILDGGEQELTPAERDMIKKVVSKGYAGSVISPQVHALLEDDA